MEPRDAATVMIIRNQNNSDSGPIEVFMLKRNVNLDFVGGAYVFPGGAVDSADIEVANDGALSDSRSLFPSELSRNGSDGLRFRVAAIRECFEEAGLMMARRSGSSSLISLNSAADKLLFEAYRDALNRKEISFEELLRAEGLLLATEEFYIFSHWITPKGAVRRYDTRFFLAVAPTDQVALHDDYETVANVWIEPLQAIRQHKAGEFDLILPTVKNLEAISGFANVKEAIEGARALESIPVIMPRLVRDGTGTRILLPGDYGFGEANDDALDPNVALPSSRGGPPIS